MAERRRPLENDDGQGSLFGGDACAPWDAPARADSSQRPTAPQRPIAPQRPTAPQRPIAPRSDMSDAAAPAPPPAASSGAMAPDAPTRPAADELAALERAAGATVRASRAPLGGPTLDDVMSRAWEGLVTGVPAACPVCHGEVVPSLHGPLRGRCTSCGTMID